MEPRINPMGKGSTRSRAVVESIFRYRARFIQTFAIVISLVVLYALLSPRQYRSEVNILVRKAPAEYQIAPERANESAARPDATAEKIDSAIGILRSREVADSVVDPEWNLSAKQNKTSSQMREHEKAVETFIKHLDIEVLRKANIIHVSYDTSSAKAATETVGRILETFLAKQNEFVPPRGASRFLVEQKTYKRELDAAQQQLAVYQQTHQVVSLPDKEVALERQIVELQQQIRSTDVQITDFSNRLTSGKKELQTLSQRQTTQQKTVPNILAMEQLSTMLAGYRNQKTALLTKFLPTDRLVQEVDQQIVNTSEALHTASEIQPFEKTTDVNPVWQQVRSVVAQNEMDRNAAIARRKDQSAQLANLQTTLMMTESFTVDFNTLQEKVTELQQNYQMYTQKRNEAQIASATDQNQLVDAAIVERPTFSATPSNPGLLFVLPLGVCIAFFFSLCTVFVLEMARDTIESPWELAAVTTVPILAVCPFIKADYLPFREIHNPTCQESSSNMTSVADSVMGGFYVPLAASFRSIVKGDLVTRLSSIVPKNKGSGKHVASQLTLLEGISP